MRVFESKLDGSFENHLGVNTIVYNCRQENRANSNNIKGKQKSHCVNLK